MVLLVLFAAVLNPTLRSSMPDPARVAVVTTGPGGAAAVDALRARIGDDADLVVVGAPEAPAELGFAERVAEAALAAAPTVLVVLWTGSFEHTGVSVEVEEPAVALSAVPEPTIEPADCRVRWLRPMSVGRPGALEVQAVGVPSGVRGELVVTGPDGAELVRRTLDAAALESGSAVPVLFEPIRAGRHAFTLRLDAGDSQVVGRGAFEVGAPPMVCLVGEYAAELAGALDVQGLAVQVAPALPEDLAGIDVVLALDPTTAAEQERLVAWVDAGGGLFLVGADGGGAVPGPTEPLHALLPVVCAPRRPPAAGEAGSESGSGGDNSPPDPTPAKTESDPVPPVESEQPKPPKPSAEPEKPAKGNTGGAELRDGPEVEVEKRSVAMVLVIDRSGSMSERAGLEGVTKMQYAKTSAHATAQALTEGDLLGVVTFGENGQIVLPLTSAVEQERIRVTLEQLRPFSERTLLAHALEVATAMLPPGVAAVRHIVVISDGIIHDSMGGSATAVLRARDALRAGVTVSVIQIADPYTEAKYSHEIAKRGGGKFHRRENAAEVPRLVLAEVVSALGKVGRAPGNNPDGDPSAGGNGDPERSDPDPPTPDPHPPDPDPEPAPKPEPPAALDVVAVARSALLEPDPEAGFPPVGGVLDVSGREDGRVLLVARRGKKGVPLLAFCNRGVGKLGVWTSSLRGGWGQAWRDDPSFPARLAQWVSALVPPLRDAGPRDLLEEATLTPSAPVRAEREAMRRLAGGALAALQTFEPPPAGVRVETRGRAHELALAGLVGLLLLVLLEFVATRLRGRRA